MSDKIETVIYVRSASPSLGTLDKQRINGHNYAVKNNLNIRIIEDISPSTLQFGERPGMKWLMNLIEVGIVRTVIVDQFCRISRNSYDLMNFCAFLEKHNAKLIVLTEVEKSE